MKPFRRSYYADPIFVTGVTRAGKSMMSPIVASFENAAIVQVSLMAEQFAMLNRLELMSDDVAQYLLRYWMDGVVVDVQLGRNINIRANDMSSIWQTSDPLTYFKRMFSEENVDVKQLENNNMRIVFNVHYALIHLDIYLKAFPGVKFINVVRHPVDVVYSWFKKGYCLEESLNIRTGMLYVEKTNEPINYYTLGWEEEYKALNQMDRIIKSIYQIEMLTQEKIASFNEAIKAHILQVCFENMVTQPHQVLKEICQFVNMDPSIYTPSILHKERCPRVLNENERKSKLEEIRRLASDEYLLLLNDLIVLYGDK